MHNSFYYLLLISILLINCSEDEQNPCPESAPLPNITSDMIPEWISEYYWFEQGSYWVYQLQGSNLTDSINVDSTYCLAEGINYHRYCHFLQSYLGSQCFQDIYQKNNTSPFPITTKVRWNYPGPVTSFTSGDFFGRSSRYDSISEDITVPAGTFPQAKRMDVDLDYPDTLLQITYHYAKGVGMIKHHNQTTGEIWELVRYSVIQ